MALLHYKRSHFPPETGCVKNKPVQHYSCRIFIRSLSGSLCLCSRQGARPAHRRTRESVLLSAPSDRKDVRGAVKRFIELYLARAGDVETPLPLCCHDPPPKPRPGQRNLSPTRFGRSRHGAVISPERTVLAAAGRFLLNTRALRSWVNALQRRRQLGLSHTCKVSPKSPDSAREIRKQLSEMKEWSKCTTHTSKHGF